MTNQVCTTVNMELSLGMSLGVAGMLGAWLYFKGRVTPPLEELFKTPVGKVSKLCVYPVKSCRRIEVDSIDCWRRGLKYDRAFVVVDKTGHFASQRQYPTMALIQPRINLTTEEEGVSLFLTAPGMEEIEVKVPSHDCKATEVIEPPTLLCRVWGLSGEGTYVGDEVGAWVSRYLGKEGFKVYFMSPRHKGRVLEDREIWADFTRPGEESSFSDYAPLLLASEASLELLNSKLEEKVQIKRFRPNIIVTDCPSHAEDYWPVVRIGSVLIRNLKPCARCKMITVDQDKGVFTKGEPMDTLFKYRFHSMIYKGVNDERFSVTPLFGQHYAVIKQGKIKVGDLLYIREEQ